MNFSIDNMSGSPVMPLRRAGYTFQHHTPEPGKMSFVRELGRNGYPRFHVYVTMAGTTMHLSIHIDHNKHTHGDGPRHNGEYETDGALGEEVTRLRQIIH